MVLSEKQIDAIIKIHELAEYPKSKKFYIGFNLARDKHIDAAIAAWKRGAAEDSCVSCMYFLAREQYEKKNNIHVAYPWVVEAVLRGHRPSIGLLIQDYYSGSMPAPASALMNFLGKILEEFGSVYSTIEQRKAEKREVANMCCTCGKIDSEEKIFEKCGICKHYSYCGKKCQLYHWKEGKHMNECRLLKILHTYGKPRYIKEIHEAIVRGDDPKTIERLQTVRSKIGLSRPTEEYEDLILLLNDADNFPGTFQNNVIPRGMKVQVKGLVKASIHNGKYGIVTKVSVPGEAGGSPSRRVGVKLLDDRGTVLSIKIENLESAVTMNNRRPNRYEYLVARKDGTLHIGSTPNMI